MGAAMNKNIRMNMGNCHHRKYIPKLIEMVRTGLVDPLKIITKQEQLTDAIEAYRQFDKRLSGWTKTELNPAAL